MSRFVENSSAQTMLRAGNYYWNSEMFLLASDVFLNECELFVLPVYKIAKGAVDLDFLRFLDFLRLRIGRETPEVKIGKLLMIFGVCESVYITQGDPHGLSNPRKILREPIKIQTGSYLGDDDIVRSKMNSRPDCTGCRISIVECRS